MTKFQCRGCIDKVGGVLKVWAGSPVPYGYCVLAIKGGAATPKLCPYGFQGRVNWKRV